MSDGTHVRGLRHQAFVYGSLEEFVTVLAPHVRRGVEREDFVLVVTCARNWGALREELGPLASRVDFRESGPWYENPATTLDDYRHRIQARRSGGATVVGEPVWCCSDSAQREWARYESVVNVAFAGEPVDLVCPYDGQALPDSVLLHAVHTHPEFRESGDGVRASPAFVPPELYPSLLVPADHAPREVELPLGDVRGLLGIRRAVAEEAKRAGLSDDRVTDVVLAVNEIAANAVRHGRPPVLVGIGSTRDELVVQVEDSGAGIRDPFAGWLPREQAASGGYGMLIARRLSHAMDIAAEEGRATVTLHFGLGDRRSTSCGPRSTLRRR